jgi:hypothetical protein
MNTDLMMIPLGFIMLSAILLWFVIGSKGKWWIKAFMIVFVCHFCFMIWHSLNGLMGWPVDGLADGNYQVIWVDIKEPSLTNPDGGSGIFVWVKNLEDEGGLVLFNPESKKIEDNEPRAYKMPYDKELAKDMQGMKGAIGKGGRFALIVENGAGEKGKKKGRGLSQDSEIKFYPLPPAKLPPKNN